MRTRANPKSKRVDYTANRKARIDKLWSLHEDKFYAEGFTHDGAMMCSCEIAKQLRALLRLDALGESVRRR